MVAVIQGNIKGRAPAPAGGEGRPSGSCSGRPSWIQRSTSWRRPSRQSWCRSLRSSGSSVILEAGRLESGAGPVRGSVKCTHGRFTLDLLATYHLTVGRGPRHAILASAQDQTLLGGSATVQQRSTVRWVWAADKGTAAWGVA